MLHAPQYCSPHGTTQRDGDSTLPGYHTYALQFGRQGNLDQQKSKSRLRRPDLEKALAPVVYKVQPRGKSGEAAGRTDRRQSGHTLSLWIVAATLYSLSGPAVPVLLGSSGELARLQKERPRLRGDEANVPDAVCMLHDCTGL